MALIDMLERRWRYGGPFDVWVRYHDLIKDLVTSAKIPPISPEKMPGGFRGLAAPQEAPALQFRPIPFPGGMRIPHFHLGDGIYLVDEKQWNQFSERVMKDLTARLANAKQVSFEQMMDVADAVQGLG